MNAPNDGGPAFPGQWYDFQPTTGEQVVRESFAAAALQAYALEYHERMSGEDIASQCYSLADAMLAHRKTHP
jgi:hypothetical protein